MRALPNRIRRVILIGGGLVLALIPLAILGVVIVSAAGLPPAFLRPQVTQPIAFPHNTHVQAARLDCAFCHRNVTTGDAATVPAVEQCMFCHQVVATERPEIQKLISYWQQNQPINWNRVHRLPDHVHFVHSVHVQRGFACATCHGAVENVGKEGVQQVRPLKMGDCMNCHRENNGPTDCGVCHY
jgi:hypothetical protein